MRVLYLDSQRGYGRQENEQPALMDADQSATFDCARETGCWILRQPEDFNLWCTREAPFSLLCPLARRSRDRSLRRLFRTGANSTLALPPSLVAFNTTPLTGSTSLSLLLALTRAGLPFIWLSCFLANLVAYVTTNVYGANKNSIETR